MGVMAAADPPGTGSKDELLVVAGGIVVAAIGSAGLVLSSWFSGRNKTTPAPTPVVPDLAWRDYVSGELAVGRRRADDGDEQDEIQDRRLDQIERVLDIDNPEWRHR